MWCEANYLQQKAARGESPSNPIDLDDLLPDLFIPPKLESKPSRSPSIIFITSDSDNNLDCGDVDMDFDPPDISKLARCPMPALDQGRPLMLLLCELDNAFPGRHDFLSYTDSFMHAGVMHVGNLNNCDHNVLWLMDVFDMPEPSALVLMGSALAVLEKGL